MRDMESHISLQVIFFYLFLSLSFSILISVHAARLWSVWPLVFTIWLENCQRHRFILSHKWNDAIVEAKGVQCLLRTKSQLNRRRMCVCVCYGQQFSAVFSSLSFSVWWCLWTLNRISLNFKWIVLIYGYCC